MPARIIDMAAAVTTAVAASSGPAVSSTPLWAAVEKYGIIAGLLLFFIWRDYCNQKSAERREAALILRINAIEEARAKEHTDVIEANTEALKDVAESLKKCHKRTPTTDALSRHRVHG